MCVVCVTVAGTVVVASQITPIQVLSDFTSSQKTLTSFAGSSSALSAKQRSEIKVLVDGSPEADAVVCTGLTLKGASRSVITTARNRAKASCDYAKRLNPFLETTVVTRTTSSRTNAGRVTVQVRSPKEQTSSPLPSTGAGERCAELGGQITVSDKSLECRYIKGKQLVWVEVNQEPKPFKNPISAQPVETCKLTGEIDGNHITGFGVDISLRGKYGNNERRPMPAVGVNESIIVPVDFSDFPGDLNLKDILAEQKQQLQSWVDYHSAGKLKFNVATYDSWIRMPQKASFYNQTDYDLSAPEGAAVGGQERITQIAQLYIDTLTNYIDLTKYKTVYILYPSQQNVIKTDLVPRMVPFKVKEGTTVLSVFARSTYDHGMKTPFWAFYLHETQHDWGLYGHAPGNGWPIGLSVNQSGYSLAMNAWERFVLTWMPDELVYCDTKADLKTAEVKLSALEREDSQTKMIAIKLDQSRLIVVETHGAGKWTSRRDTQNYNFKTRGFYGVVAYVVDTKFTTDRPFVKPDGSALESDDGVTRAIPRYAYMYPIDGPISSHEYGLVNMGPGTDYGRYIAVQGDSITIEGVKITVVSTGDYETVRVESAG